MGRSPRYSKDGLNKGAWTAEEDKILTDYVKVHGEGKWSNVSKNTELKRCGKSCRLRWMNYLRPDIKRGNISLDEEELIIRLHKLLGNRWSLIAGRLPGRTDNEIKNYWNTNLAKKSQDLQLTMSKQAGTQKGSALSKPPFNDVLEPLLLNNRTVITNKVVTTQQESQSQRNHQQVPPPNNKGTNLHQPVLQIVERAKPSHDGQQWAPGGKNPLGFAMDFDVEDLCKILDDVDFSRLDGIHIGDNVDVNAVIDGGDNEVVGGNKSHGDNIKDEENNEDTHEQVEGSDFLSMLSFLDPVPAEWAEDDLHF